MKGGRVFGCTVAAFIGAVLLLAGVLCGLYFTADMKQPGVSLHGIAAYPLVKGDSLRTYGDNWLRLTAAGLWELHVGGTGFERGVAAGKLSEDLLYYQEKVFVDKIREFIPSDSYLKWLRFLLVLFNRKLGDYVPEENREEIYGISLSCTHDYDAIGTPYQRQLNYHAAHDIGHAMQDYMLVGCSSFGVWGKESADSSLLIGRNFDFYMGDDFARHKVVSFFRPAEGYRFASVGWAGMTGVLSGMNEAGLTVTINAAKSSLPLYAAMPISLLAREILQYAATIDEAYAIASRRRTFVAESLLIGSAADGRAAVIEKSVDRIALFRPDTERIVCTNHYQSEAFAGDKRNAGNIATSDSPYRYERMNELLDACRPVDAPKAASVLRNHLGKQGKEIGLANEKAINQFIAHHSVIFKPESRLMWVSTAPWQSGGYVAYDLNSIFAGQGTDARAVDSLAIAPDTLLHSPVYQQLLTYRRLSEQVRMSIRNHTVLADTVIEHLIASNPELYNVWLLAGDYCHASGNREKAAWYWEKALTKEIPKADERTAIEKKIKR